MNVPDIGFRLVYELSYLGVKKFSLFFHYKGGPLRKKNSKIFQKQGMTIYAPIESPCRDKPSLVAFKNVCNYFWPKKY